MFQHSSAALHSELQTQVSNLFNQELLNHWDAETVLGRVLILPQQEVVISICDRL
jgi:hypothetical protein